MVVAVVSDHVTNPTAYICHAVAVRDSRVNVLLVTEEYHIENGNSDQYLTLHQFKGSDISQLLLSEDGNVELTDYSALLAASHTGLSI